MANDSVDRTVIENRKATKVISNSNIESKQSTSASSSPNSSPKPSSKPKSILKSSPKSSPKSSFPSSNSSPSSLTTSFPTQNAAQKMQELLNSNNMESKSPSMEPSAAPAKKSANSLLSSESSSGMNMRTSPAPGPYTQSSRAPGNSNNKSSKQQSFPTQDPNLMNMNMSEYNFPISPANSVHSNNSGKAVSGPRGRSIHSITNELASQVNKRSDSSKNMQYSMLESSLRAPQSSSNTLNMAQKSQRQLHSKSLNGSQSLRRGSATPNYHSQHQQQNQPQNVHHNQPNQQRQSHPSLPNNYGNHEVDDDDEALLEGDEYDMDNNVVNAGNINNNLNLSNNFVDEDEDEEMNNDNDDLYEHMNNEQPANPDMFNLLGAFIASGQLPNSQNFAALASSMSTLSSLFNQSNLPNVQNHLNNPPAPSPIQNRLSSQAIQALQSSIRASQNLPGTSGTAGILPNSVPEETISNSHNDTNNTIYRGLYPIKDVKEYFTRTINDEGEKVYSCKFAGCTFQTKQYSQHISRHIYLKHIGIKKELRCRQCEKKFQRPESLVQHEKNHVCGFGIDQDRMNDPANPCGKVNIKKHFKKVTDHEFDVYQCQFGNCKFHTNNSGSIRRHVHNQHICAYGAMINSGHSGSNLHNSNQSSNLASSTSSNPLLNSSTSSAGGNTLSNSTSSLRSSLTNSGLSWTEVEPQCQLVVGDQEYRPEASDDSSRPSSQTGIRSDEEEDEPMNLMTQPDCPIRNPIDQQQFDDENSVEDLSGIDVPNSILQQPNIAQSPQSIFEQLSDLANFANLPPPIVGSPTQSSGSGSKQKNNGLYSLKNYKQYYTKKRTEDGNSCVFVCTICNKFQANQQISLIRHIWTEIQHQNFACEFEGCNEKFSSEFARYRHRKTVHHQGQNPPPGTGNELVNLQELATKMSNFSSSSTAPPLDALNLIRSLTQANNSNFNETLKPEAKGIQKQEQKFQADQNDQQMAMNQLLLNLLNNGSRNGLSNFQGMQNPNSLMDMFQGGNSSNFGSASTLPALRAQLAQQPPSKTDNELIKGLLNAPSGAFGLRFDNDTLSESSRVSSEPPSKRSRTSPKHENTGQLPDANSASPEPLELHLRTALTTTPEAQQKSSAQQSSSSVPEKSKNPAKSGLYSLKAHQDRYVRKKKETGNGYEYSCKDCQEYTTSSQASMVRHIWSHGQQDFSCNVCDEKFENEFNLYKHKKSLHPEATTQHNRGVKGNSKKAQAQNLKRQQQLLQQQQQNLQNQQNPMKSQLMQQLKNQLPDLSSFSSFNRQNPAPEESLLMQNLQSLQAPFSMPSTSAGLGFGEPNLMSLMQNTPTLMFQFMEFLQKQQNEFSVGDTSTSRQQNFYPHNDLSGREMSSVEQFAEDDGVRDEDYRDENDRHREEDEEIGDEDREVDMGEILGHRNHNSDVQPSGASPDLKHWIQAAMAASEGSIRYSSPKSTTSNLSNKHGHSRRSSQLKNQQKNYSTNMPNSAGNSNINSNVNSNYYMNIPGSSEFSEQFPGGKIRAIADQAGSQGDRHRFNDDDDDENDDANDDNARINVDNTDDNDCELNGENVRGNLHSENDTEDEDLNNNGRNSTGKTGHASQQSMQFASILMNNGNGNTSSGSKKRSNWSGKQCNSNQIFNSAEKLMFNTEEHDNGVGGAGSGNNGFASKLRSTKNSSDTNLNSQEALRTSGKGMKRQLSSGGSLKGGKMNTRAQNQWNQRAVDEQANECSSDEEKDWKIDEEHE